MNGTYTKLGAACVMVGLVMLLISSGAESCVRVTEENDPGSDAFVAAVSDDPCGSPPPYVRISDILKFPALGLGIILVAAGIGLD
jgi:hypothetical protein